MLDKNHVVYTFGPFFFFYNGANVCAAANKRKCINRSAWWSRRMTLNIDGTRISFIFVYRLFLAAKLFFSLSSTSFDPRCDNDVDEVPFSAVIARVLRSTINRLITQFFFYFGPSQWYIIFFIFTVKYDRDGLQLIVIVCLSNKYSDFHHFRVVCARFWC